MDVHIRRAVTSALRLRSIDVLTAQEDGAAELDDDGLLERATELGRVLVSQDEDLLREGARRVKEHKAFSGIIYSHQLRITIGQMFSNRLENRTKDRARIAPTSSDERFVGILNCSNHCSRPKMALWGHS
jgi:Domain of unknown function (DUF5615)